MLEKRTALLGDYDTASHGWTLNKCSLGEAEPKTYTVEKKGGDGSWDLSTVLTDGIIRYKDRPLELRFECSEGTRADRHELISEMVNELDGQVLEVVLPDWPEHYVTGRLKVKVEYNDLAHAAVVVTSTVKPWLYRRRETIVELTATNSAKTVLLRNDGRRAVCPLLTVTGSVRLVYGTSSTSMGEGTYEWPNLLLTRGDHLLEYSGAGSVVITYREAVLR